ncbi:hypothetical protein DL240_05600 [Lujinxingia litoralis]|uniref:Uncharacterized protein n=1 Tax=Lujinxingia litoralis TaxID=2211119 RepID=A0A328C6R8_9DELT|nr:hypothetical protein DL240_05600 [Lujinxingia litoralis]
MQPPKSISTDDVDALTQLNHLLVSPNLHQNQVTLRVAGGHLQRPANRRQWVLQRALVGIVTVGGHKIRPGAPALTRATRLASLAARIGNYVLRKTGLLIGRTFVRPTVAAVRPAIASPSVGV